MAPAGIVTGDSSVFGEMVAGYPAQIRDLAMASRALIFAVLPQTVEVVWRADLESPALRQLVEAATTHRVPPIARPEP